MLRLKFAEDVELTDAMVIAILTIDGGAVLGV